MGISPPGHTLSFLKLVKVGHSVVHHPSANLASFRLTEKGNKRYHPYQDEPDAHKIIEDLREDHHYYAKDKADDSSNEPHIR
jgi:hypothetical protein